MGWTEEMDIEGTRNLFERSVREVKRAKAIFMIYSFGQTSVSPRINLKPMMIKSWRKNDLKPYYFRLWWSGDMSHSYVSSTSRCSVVFARRSLFLLLSVCYRLPLTQYDIDPDHNAFYLIFTVLDTPPRFSQCDIKCAPTKCALTIF